MALEQSYTSQPSGSGSGSGARAQPAKGDYWDLGKLKKSYTSFLTSKRDELEESRDSRRYYHSSQWTQAQVKVMNKRKQPVMTFNRIARKIDGTIGVIEKMRQDPKAYARTPQHEQGADLATAALKYVLDEQAWKEKSPIAASDGAVGGIGGIAVTLTQGDHGDPEIGLELVDATSFFYDARSYKAGFDDAAYMGEGKWVMEDDAIALGVDPDTIPDGAYELTSDADKDRRWFQTEGATRRVRMVECWYQHKGGWCWAVFTGSSIVSEGKSYLTDEKGKTFCKYIMFSGNVDQDGDRYGFVRNMKSAQDGINARQSKMQHILASRRIILSQGAVDDIEKVRAEWARPDGVVVTNRPVNEGVKTDDQSFDFSGWTKMLELNLAEIENFGPNQALLGQEGVAKNSGRAIALLQQAGMADLGPFILAYRGWKTRLYRAIWNAIQQHWKAERWVRVTDSQDLAQYIQINGLQMTPQGPQLVNAIGSLDVDIILDEGPDNINAMADVYDTLSNILPSIAPVLSPGKAQAVVDILIDSSPLPYDVKKRFKEQSQQMDQQQGPPPEVQAMQAKAQIDLDKQKQSAALDAQKQEQSNAFSAQKQAADNAAKHESNLMDIEHQAATHHMARKALEQKHAIEMDHLTNKSNVQKELENHKANVTKQVEEHKASKTDTGQLKAITDTFAKSLENIAKTVEDVANKVTEPKKKKVDLIKDKSGRITAATVTEV